MSGGRRAPRVKGRNQVRLVIARQGGIAQRSPQRKFCLRKMKFWKRIYILTDVVKRAVRRLSYMLEILDHLDHKSETQYFEKKLEQYDNILALLRDFDRKRQNGIKDSKLERFFKYRLSLQECEADLHEARVSLIIYLTEYIEISEERLARLRRGEAAMEGGTSLCYRGSSDKEVRHRNAPFLTGLQASNADVGSTNGVARAVTWPRGAECTLRASSSAAAPGRQPGLAEAAERGAGQVAGPRGQHGHEARGNRGADGVDGVAGVACEAQPSLGDVTGVQLGGGQHQVDGDEGGPSRYDASRLPIFWATSTASALPSEGRGGLLREDDEVLQAPPARRYKPAPEGRGGPPRANHGDSAAPPARRYTLK